jgi:hypothetical protein
MPQLVQPSPKTPIHANFREVGLRNTTISTSGYHTILFLNLSYRTPISDGTIEQLQSLVSGKKTRSMARVIYFGHASRFYVDTNANPPTPVWVHPLGPPSQSSPPPLGPGSGPNLSDLHIATPISPTIPGPGPAPAKAASPPAPGEPENPDKRPMPHGWVQRYDSRYVVRSPMLYVSTGVHSSYKAWFYVDTNSANPTPSWTHPSGPRPASQGPQSTSGPASPAPPKAISPPPQPATPGQPENPDKRPLPAGWIQQYDSK